jgi:Arc/MetJ-type ribon-helix-helix transcriptional regulator
MTKTVDLTKFNAVSEANEGGEMELSYKGEGTGVYLKVLGKNSDAVRAHVRESLKDYARKNAMAEKRGELIDFQVKLIDRLDERSIENALVRVTAWRGATGDYSKDTMRGVLERNPQWVDDIMEFSDFLERSKANTPKD